MKYKVATILGYLVFIITGHSYAGGWLVYHDGPYAGKVVDAETGEPIEGAAVVAIWFVGEYGHAEAPIFKFLEAKETVTTENGAFKVPSFTSFHLWPFAKLVNPRLKVFKPGYGNFDAFIQGKKENLQINLHNAKTKMQRLESIVSIDVCEKKIDDTCVPRNKIPKLIYLIERETEDLKKID